MRITLEISPATLKRIMSVTKEDKKSPAVAKALDDYLRIQTLKDFSKKIQNNEFNFPLTNKDLEELNN